MNSVNIIGRLTMDPEVYNKDGGKTLCVFTLALEDVFAREKRADFIRVKVWGSQAENCKRYLKKGKMTAVNGRLFSDKYMDKEGITRYPIEVIANQVQFLPYQDKKPETGAQPSAAPSAPAPQEHTQSAPPTAPIYAGNPEVYGQTDVPF